MKNFNDMYAQRNKTNNKIADFRLYDKKKK